MMTPKQWSTTLVDSVSGFIPKILSDTIQDVARLHAPNAAWGTVVCRTCNGYSETEIITWPCETAEVLIQTLGIELD